MSSDLKYYYLTFRDYVENCISLTCKGHNPPLKINCEENGTMFYTMNRHQLNEFWNCCLNDQKTFCSLICHDSCKVCKLVKTVYTELKDNFSLILIKQNQWMNNLTCGKFLVLILMKNVYLFKLKFK